MATRIKRFSILQAGKLLAVLYGFVSVVLLPIFLLVAVFSSKGGTAPMLTMLILYPILGFVGGILGAALYNLAARFVGGLEVTLEQTE